MRLNARTSFARTVALGCLLSPIALSAAAVETKPAAATPTKPTPAQAAESRRAAQKAMTSALANLSKEYQAYATDKTKATKLREKSDYFLENKTTDLTDLQILQQMNQPIAQDAAADAYIKWQLMSGLSDKIEDKALIEPLYMAYTKGPAIPHRPGMAAEEKTELDKLVHGVKGAGAETINAINDKLKVPVDAWLAKITPIIAYRDALHKKLPANSVFEHSGRLADLIARWTAGVEVEKLSETWRLETKAWVKGNPAPREAAFLADQLLKFIDDWGGIPKKPAASAGPSDQVFASKSENGDDASAPVILAAGKNYPPGGMNPNYPGYPGQGMKKEFPPKYYEQVEFDVKTNALKWADVSGKFVKKDLIIELYQDLRDAGKAAPAVAPNMKADPNMKSDPNMKGAK